MKLIILGAGGYGKTVYDVAVQSGKYNEICFLDDNSTDSRVVGKCGDFEKYISEDTEIYPAFGNNKGRLEWIDNLLEMNAKVPTIVHATSYISPTVKIGVGSVVLPKAVINTDTEIGRGVIVNCASVIDHGCIIGDGVHVCLGAIVKAENRIPDCMKIEAGEVIENRKFPL
ncbi:MAG: hypothetical protein E7613_07775 [Ruminococcaceae bacterium]|nr:hypothetical protein [Oscillospiraceae bacterium]